MRPLTTTAPRRVDGAEGVVQVVADVVDAGDSWFAADLWFSVPAEYAELLGDRADHVAVGLLLPAMRYGRDLHVGGVVTDVLLHRLNREVQALVEEVHPSYSRVTVSADVTAPPPPPAAGVATGFSGGVDSFAVLTEYALPDDVPDALRVTHLLSNNVGAYGDGGRALWRARYGGLRPVADKLGLPFVQVDSNLDDHYRNVGFFETVSFRNMAVAHLLGGGVGHLHYASADSFRDVRVPSDGDIGRIDALVAPLLSTPALTIESANSDLTRVQKTLALVGTPYVPFVDVCIDWDATRTSNCSRCWKCMRTMLTLEIAGHLDEFTPVPFQRQPYEQHRSQYLVELLASDAPLSRQLVQFARENGWRWGAAPRARASLVRAKRFGRERLRAARNRLRRAD